MAAKKKPAAPAAKKAAVKATAAPKADDPVTIVCTCDRLPLQNGEVLVRDMTASVPPAHALNYEAAERAKRV